MKPNAAFKTKKVINPVYLPLRRPRRSPRAFGDTRIQGGSGRRGRRRHGQRPAGQTLQPERLETGLIFKSRLEERPNYVSPVCILRLLHRREQSIL